MSPDLGVTMSHSPPQLDTDNTPELRWWHVQSNYCKVGSWKKICMCPRYNHDWWGLLHLPWKMRLIDWTSWWIDMGGYLRTPLLSNSGLASNSLSNTPIPLCLRANSWKDRAENWLTAIEKLTSCCTKSAFMALIKFRFCTKHDSWISILWHDGIFSKLSHKIVKRLRT